ARYRQFVAEDQRPVEPARVEPQPGIVDPFLRRESGDDVFGICPPRHDARADKRGGLDMVQTGLGERPDQPDLVLGADRTGFDLEAFARSFLVDLHMRRQIGHLSFLAKFGLATMRTTPSSPRRPACANPAAALGAPRCRSPGS